MKTKLGGIDSMACTLWTGHNLLSAIAVSFALMSGGCASSGRDFARPEPESLVLGQTTIAEVISKYGQPVARTARSSGSPVSSNRPGDQRPPGLQPASVAGDIETLRYSYAHASKPGVIVGPIVAQGRSLSLSFWNSRLVYYGFNSSFSDDTTNFDENKVSSFVRGQTTRADVIRELGRPSGEGIYPHVAKEGTKMVTYQYVASNSTGTSIIGSKRVMTIKLVQFLFDTSDRLSETYTSTAASSTQTNQ